MILSTLKNGIEQFQDELKSLEEEHKKAKSTVEEVRQSADLGEGALWNKKNQESLKKLQLKLTYECEDLEKSQSRASALSADPNNHDLWAIWTRKVETQNEIMRRLQE